METVKKALSVSIIVLFCLYAFLPLCVPLGILTSYEITLRGPLVCAGVLFAFSLLLTVACFYWRDVVLGKVSDVLAALMLPLGILTWFILFIESDGSAVVLLFAILSLACLAFLLTRPRNLPVLKVLSGSLAVLLALPVAFLVALELLLSGFVENTVEQEIKSPNGMYVAQMVVSDQGALGGDTIVEVRRDDRTIDLLVIRLTKTPIDVYHGNWTAHKTMQIEWQDETTLLINGEAYHIDID